MALETPNAIIASAVVYYDGTLLSGEAFSLRSAVGVASIASLYDFDGPRMGMSAQLEQPASNDEAMVVTNNAVANNGAIEFGSAFITPNAQLFGDASYDGAIEALPKNSVVLLAEFQSFKTRFGFFVLKQITSVPAIAGEPLP